nr:DUF1205 domain-containing protein [Streptomyces sp.]
MISRILRLSTASAPESGVAEPGFAVSVIGSFLPSESEGTSGVGVGPLRPDQDETSSALEVKRDSASPRSRPTQDALGPFIRTTGQPCGPRVLVRKQDGPSRPTRTRTPAPALPRGKHLGPARTVRDPSASSRAPGTLDPRSLASAAMRFLFVSGGSAGAVFPITPLALAARNAGHEVIVGATENVMPLVAATGLPGAPITSRTMFDFMQRDRHGNPLEIPKDPHERNLFNGRGMARLALGSMEGLVPLVERWQPDVLVAGALSYAAPLVAHRFGLPWVRHALNMGEPSIIDLSAAAELAPELEEMGLSAIPEPDMYAGWLPLDVVLRTCDLLVHRAGGNTMLHAIVCGVPQLVIPAMPKQVGMSARLAEYGAAIMLTAGQDDSPENVAKACRELLEDPAYKARTDELSREIAGLPAPHDVTVAITEMVRARARG